MNTFKKIGIEAGKAICYSGFRDGQQPGLVSPTYQQVKEDLLLLQENWKYLRLYDCDQHAETVLEVIRNEKLDFSVMLGAYINAEMNNFNCPWDGGVFSESELEKNALDNEKKISRLIQLAEQYSQVIFSLSVGNEACVEWTDHYVHENKILDYIIEVKEKAVQPVTYCENYVPWLLKFEKIAQAVDFISIHSYPVWEYKHIDEGLDYTKQNYYSVVDRFPDKPVVITEAGWATCSNGRGIDPEHVNERYQKNYYDELMKWTIEENILTFFFEAFDESWKGSPEPHEPEKHWGLFTTDRTPKLAIKSLFYKRY